MYVYTLFNTLFHHIWCFSLFDSSDFITFCNKNISKFTICFFRKTTMSQITLNLINYRKLKKKIIIPFIIVKFNSGAQTIASMLSIELK
jgi:hypothetical protein